MSVYSNTEIKEAVRNGTIVSVPYEPEHVSEASLDFTLGHYYYKQEVREESRMYNPFDEADVRLYFNGPLQAVPHHKWCEQYGYKPFKNIPRNHPIIVLKPGERILAHTHEFVGILPPGTSSMQARSTTGRIGVSACYCAGWGDPGYVNRWTMEIHNLNEAEHIVLHVGWRIAQMVFSGTGPVGSEYASASGNYQQFSGEQLDHIKAAWAPEQMLPRAYNNEILLPAPVAGMREGLR